MRWQVTSSRRISHQGRLPWSGRVCFFAAASLALTLSASAQVPVADTGTVTADACNSNGIIDPNENVTVSLGIKNTGVADTTALLATLQTAGGVTLPSAPQNYGVVVAGGATVFRSFSFTSGNLACGSTLVATLALQDGAISLGTITYDFPTGGVSGSATTDSTGNIAVLNVITVEIPLNVPETMALSDVNVSFRLNHPFDSDLIISLVHPDNTVIPLVVHRGGSGDNFGSGANDCSGTGTEFDDQAITAVTAGTAPFAGSFRPESPLAALNGKPSNGTWKLRVSDTAAIDTGTVGCFKLQLKRFVCCGTIAAAPPATVTAENQLPLNAAPDPGETLTVDLPLVNVGGDTTNLVATLLATGGVTNPSGPQSYGVVVGGGAAVARPFTFTALANCGSSITLTLALQDGGVSLGTITYTLQMGTTVLGTQTFANPAAIAIPDSAAATPYPSNIAVSGVGPVAAVTVKLKQFNHTFPNDVDVLLVSPTGQKMIIMSDAGGGTDAVSADLLLDDGAATALPGAIVSGTFRPTNNGAGDTFTGPAPAGPYLSAAPAGTDGLNSAFAGLDPNGIWSLYVVDDLGGDTGNLNGGWEISFTTAVCNNTPPIGRDDAYSTNEDIPLVVPPPGVLVNDTDPHGYPMTIGLLTAPAHGVISTIDNVTGAFTYSPTLDYHGPDSFTYRLSDLVGNGNVTTVSLTVNSVNDAPVANPEAYAVDEDGVLTVSALIGVLVNDTDVDGDPLTAVLDSGPSNAAAFSLTSATGAFSYTPNANFNGVDSFTYHARDGSLDSATVTVTITVNSVNDVPSFTKGPNQHVVGGAPTTVNNWATAISKGPANESGQTLTFLVTNDHPEFFTAQPAVNPAGTLTFDPAPDANGVATVTVRLMDSGTTANGGIDTSAAQTFTIRVVDLIVNSANDVDDLVCNATHCSLREAINFANVSPNLNGAPDTIRFAIPGAGPHTIPIGSALPAVAEPTIIDATTQPGYAGPPLVELNGTSAGLGVAGLRLGAGASVVAALAVNRFEGHGIEITGPGGNYIVVNFVGTDPTGLLARPNGGSGIRISGSSNNGVFSNVVSGNGRAGVRLEAGADFNELEDNVIGLGADTTTPVPNGENGILVLSGSSNLFFDNSVAHNNTQGVQISAGLHNTIRYNSIHSNGLLGIELGADGVTPNDAGDADTGANGLQNYPVLTRATTSPTTTGISGTFSGAPNTQLALDYYVSDTCDPSGYGEGASRLNGQSVTTDAGGQAVIQISSGFAATTAGRYLTATATSPQGDTSEFSACRKIDPLPTLTLTGGETAGVLQINEGNPTGGPPTQALTFFVQLSSPSALPVSVTYQTTDGTAQSPSDYLSLSGTLLFAPGETLKQLVVQTVLDNDPETDETFTLSLGVPTNAVPAQSLIQIVLKDDDGATGPLSLSVADVGVSEPRTGVRSARFEVSLSDPAFHTVWVDYHTVDGTANAGLDYTSATGQLVFQPGDQTKTVPVDVLADDLREGKETFFLVLTNPQEAILGRGQGTATVGDPRSFFTLKPCRLSDSRQGSGAFAAGELRTFTMNGSCGVPDTAIAISANITVAQPGGLGFIEIFPSDKIAPATSVLNFLGGQTRANNTIIVLSPAGQATVKNVSIGTTHVIVDVNGYFE